MGRNEGRYHGEERETKRGERGRQRQGEGLAEAGHRSNCLQHDWMMRQREGETEGDREGDSQRKREEAIRRKTERRRKRTTRMNE